jgi:hypothetical protein
MAMLARYRLFVAWLRLVASLKNSENSDFKHVSAGICVASCAGLPVWLPSMRVS